MKQSSKPLNIAGIIRQDTFVGYYRLLNPLMAMQPKVKYKTNYFSGKNEVIPMIEGNNEKFLQDNTLMALAKDADIIWSTILWDREEMLKMLDLRAWSGAKWILDVDDNMYAVSAENPVKSNVDKMLNNLELCCSLADGMTVSVPKLKEIYTKLNPNIYVIPNGQEPSNWKKTVYKNKKIRIGWRGASGHKADASLIAPALKELHKNYDFEFVTLGVATDIKSEHHNFVPAMEYFEVLDLMKLDIAVVPLINSPYNQCKSNIAVQEFSMLKIPVVASPTENQKDMPILYAKNNFEWYQNLEKLILDKKLREKQGQEQYEFIRNNYYEKDLVKPLIEWMKKLPRQNLSPDIKPL